MFLEKYLSPVYLDIVYNNYDNEYLKLLDEDNFNEVYNLLKRYGFYFIYVKKIKTLLFPLFMGFF